MKKELTECVEETNRLLERAVQPGGNVSDGALLFQLLYNQIAIMETLKELKARPYPRLDSFI